MTIRGRREAANLGATASDSKLGTNGSSFDLGMDDQIRSAVRAALASTHSAVDLFLGEPETRAASGIRSRSTLREMIREGRFPRPIRISPGRVAWSAAEIRAWQQERIQERDDAL
jgi:prophage regulatory protein